MAIEISSDASQVLSGASQAAVDYVTANAPGSRLTSGEARDLLAKYNASPQAALDAQNISSTTTSPTYAPDDLLGIRTALSTELGITDKESAYTSAYEALKAYDLETENAARLINEQQLSTNVLSGQEATARKQRATERISLANQAEIAQSALLAAKEELNTQYGIRASEVQNMRSLILANPGAGITFSDTTESARKKIEDYNKKLAKEEEEKQKEEYKDQLKATLISLGISTKNSKGGSLSSSKMENALTEYYKEQGYTKSQMDKLDLALKQKSLAGVGASGGSSYSQSEILSMTTDSFLGDFAKARSIIQEDEKNNPNWDGFISPEQWRPLLDEWRSLDGSIKDFEKAFLGKTDSNGVRTGGFINPEDWPY